LVRYTKPVKFALMGLRPTRGNGRSVRRAKHDRSNKVSNHAVGVMPKARLELTTTCPTIGGRVSTGELLDTETVTSSSEEGGWKRTCEGNALAAYPTACSVWSGGKAARPYLSLYTIYDANESPKDSVVGLETPS
jgi:hypothetical protein